MFENSTIYAPQYEESLPLTLVGPSGYYPSQPSYDTTQDTSTPVNQPAFPQPPLNDLAATNGEPDWDALSELLNDQQDAAASSALASSSGPHAEQFRIAFAFAHNVGHDQAERVDEIEAWLSMFRLDSDECAPGQTRGKTHCNRIKQLWIGSIPILVKPKSTLPKFGFSVRQCWNRIRLEHRQTVLPSAQSRDEPYETRYEMEDGKRVEKN